MSFISFRMAPRGAATTTTSPPPRPDGHGGRCACPEPQRIRRAPPGRFPRSLVCRSPGSALSCTPGGIAAGSRNTARGLDRPIRKRSAETIPNSNRDRAPNAHSRQFRGLLSCIGASNTGSSPTPFCLATAPGPLAAERCSIVRGCSRPPLHLRHQAAPRLHPTVTAAGGRVSHPARSYGASWRSTGLDDFHHSCPRRLTAAARGPQARRSPDRRFAYANNSGVLLAPVGCQ